MIQGHGDDAYQFGGDIHINFSSNIYGHADLSALQEFLRSQIGLITAYPEPEPYSLEQAIAEHRNIPAECVVVTNGATEAIYLIAQMLSREGYTRCFIPQPTFSEYADACRMFGLQPVAQAGEAIPAWLCNPNNPTGQVWQTPSCGGVGGAPLIIDQSYEDYTLQPLMTPAEAIARGNVVLIYSMTKTYAVPGLRIGYMIAAPALAPKLRTLLRPWSVNALAVAAGRWLIGHNGKAVADLGAYLAEAQRLNGLVNEIEGIEALPTATNFMLCRLQNRTAAELKNYLARRHGILIRDASNFAGLDHCYFRIAAQAPKENETLVEALRQFCRASL